MSGVENAEGGPQENPTERMVVPVATNAALECSRFCLTNCGLYGGTQEQVAIASMMIRGEAVVINFNDKEPAEVRLEDGSEPPKLAMRCKGPRKQYWVAGELVCRERAEIDLA